MLPLPQAMAIAVVILVGSTSASISAESQINGQSWNSHVRAVGSLHGCITRPDVAGRPRQQDVYRNLEGRIAHNTKPKNEELHLAASPEIKPIQDFAGEKVIFGRGGGDTHKTATTVFAALVAESGPVNHDQAMALQKIKTGDIVTANVADKPARAVAEFVRWQETQQW